MKKKSGVFYQEASGPCSEFNPVSCAAPYRTFATKLPEIAQGCDVMSSVLLSDRWGHIGPPEDAGVSSPRQVVLWGSAGEGAGEKAGWDEKGRGSLVPWHPSKMAGLRQQQRWSLWNTACEHVNHRERAGGRDLTTSVQMNLARGWCKQPDRIANLDENRPCTLQDGRSPRDKSAAIRSPCWSRQCAALPQGPDLWLGWWYLRPGTALTTPRCPDQARPPGSVLRQPNSGRLYQSPHSIAHTDRGNRGWANFA